VQDGIGNNNLTTKEERIMLKRLILIGLLGLLVFVPFGAKTFAVRCEPTLLALYGMCFPLPEITGNDLCVDSRLFHLRNVDNLSPSYETILFVLEASVEWRNRPGNSDRGAIHGEPFIGEALEIVDVEDSFVVRNNGNARDQACFTSGEIIAAAEAAGIDLGRPGGEGGNWRGTIHVINGHIFNTLFACIDTDGTVLGDPAFPRELSSPCHFEDAGGQNCVAPAGTGPGDTFNYICSTLCEDGEGVDCLQPPRVGNCAIGDVWNPDTSMCESP
jgi:hypothetical protein